jgi:hypothetical protein
MLDVLVGVLCIGLGLFSFWDLTRSQIAPGRDELDSRRAAWSEREALNDTLRRALGKCVEAAPEFGPGAWRVTHVQSAYSRRCGRCGEPSW